MKHLLGILSVYKRLTKLSMTDFTISQNAGRSFEQCYISVEGYLMEWTRWSIGQWNIQRQSLTH
jgi:hypothetical protein